MPVEQKEGNFVSKKFIKFQQFSDFSVDRSGPSVAVFEIFVKIEVFVSKKIFWIKRCLSSKKVFVSFLNFEQTILGLLTRSLWERFSELQSIVHSNVFLKNIFFEKKFFPQSSSVLKRNFSRFSVTFYSRVDKSAFIMSKRTIDGKQTFWKK